MNWLECWTIYDHPTDYPEHFVLRRAVVSRGAIVPDSYAMVASDVEQLRAICRDCGLTVVQTAGTDPDPKILEVWM
jgi:hypothetical protein